MKSFLSCLLLCLGCSAIRGETSSTASEITAVLTTQAAAWNRGDLDGFMAGYARIADLRFASGDNVTRGWQPTLESYKKGYPDRSAMGLLAFSDLEITVLAPDAAIAFGHWQLTREKDTPHGVFTLTFRKFADGWRIIQDHTSAASPKKATTGSAP